MEDRFLTEQVMREVSDALFDGGFKHVIAMHRIDPEWRAQYRRDRPELNGVAWTIHLGETLMPMPKTKELIAICERFDLVFWMKSEYYDGNSGGTEFYVQIAREQP